MAGFSRNYVLDRLKSRMVTPDEFNFDHIQAPPLSMFFTPFDIAELNSIARSLKYSAKPEIRYAEINRVMNRCGLVKFAAGTNRVVYRHPEFPDILFKVASDAVGLGDNPAEYRNQFLLKPFVCKCFEISPCGTVGIFERVNPIHSREEYLSVADDVFELINTWLLGEYVLADIGSNFHQNIGIRSGFGVVLLDFPYVYKLDGNKLYCNKQDMNSPTGHCDGVIDYDDGYNFLHCTKCGAIYKAKELELKIKNNEIINDNGGIKMNITISGGSNNIKKTTVDTSSNVNCALFNVTKSNTTTPVATKKVEKEVAPVEVKKENKVSVNGVNKGEDAPKVNPISFDNSLKRDNQVAEKKTPVKNIEDYIESIIANINDIDFDSVKEDTITRLISAVTDISRDNLGASNTFKLLEKKSKELLDECENQDFIDCCSDESVKDIIDTIGGVTIVRDEIDVVKDNNILSIKIPTAYSIYGTVDSEEPDKSIITYNSNNNNIDIDISDYVTTNTQVESSPEVEKVEDNSGNNNEVYKGLSFYDGEITNIRNIFPDQNNIKVIILKDREGNYLSVDGIIPVIDVLDNASLENSTVVNKKWFEKAKSILGDEEEKEESSNETPNNEEIITGAEETVIKKEV